MAVTTLMSVAVGLVVFRLDDVTERGRLRSAGSQIAAVLRTVQTQARTSGLPRLIDYKLNTDRLVLRVPQRRDGSWQWSQGLSHLTNTGVSIVRVLLEGRQQTCDVDGVCTIRVGADGRYHAHVAILELHGQYAMILCGAATSPRVVSFEKAPQASSYEELLAEVLPAHEKP